MVIDFVQSGGDRLVVVILYEALDGNAVEVTSRDTHALRELVGRFEDGIGDGDGCLHAIEDDRSRTERQSVTALLSPA